MASPAVQSNKYYEKANVLSQKGRLQEAVKFYKKAIKLNPGSSEAHNNLGNVFKNMMRFHDSKNAFLKALEIKPDDSMILNNLAILSHLMGHNNDALIYVNKAIGKKPADINSYINLGNILRNTGDYEKSSEAYEKALSIDPKNLYCLVSMGSLYVNMGDVNEASIIFRKVLSVDPYNLEAAVNLGNILLSEGELYEAESLYRQLISKGCKDKYIVNNLGSVLREKGDVLESIDVLKASISNNDCDHNTYVNIGMSLRATGDFKAAEENYLKAISLEPECSEAYRELASMKKYSEKDWLVNKMEKIHKKLEVNDVRKMNLSFGLGKIFEDLKEYDKSFGFYKEANRIKRKTSNFSIEKSNDFFKKITDVFSREKLVGYKNIGCQDGVPIFVLGMPRSGSSLVEQILSSHSSVYGAGELRDLSLTVNSMLSEHNNSDYPEVLLELDEESIRAMGESYVKKIRAHSKEAKYIVDKMPHNFIYTGLINIALPNAKIIHCKRKPLENCFSIYKNMFSGGHGYAYDMEELGKYYNLYNNMMDSMFNTFPDKMLTIHYEDLVCDQVEQTRRLIQFCDLPWEESCISYHKTNRSVVTNSSSQVRQKIFTDSLSLNDVYKEQLRPLQNIINNNITS